MCVFTFIPLSSSSLKDLCLQTQMALFCLTAQQQIPHRPDNRSACGQGLSPARSLSGRGAYSLKVHTHTLTQIKPHLSEHVEQAHRAAHPAPQDGGDHGIDAAASHATALGYADARHHGHQGNQHHRGDEDNAEHNSCVALKDTMGWGRHNTQDTGYLLVNVMNPPSLWSGPFEYAFTGRCL